MSKLYQYEVEIVPWKTIRYIAGRGQIYSKQDLIRIANESDLLVNRVQFEKVRAPTAEDALTIARIRHSHDAEKEYKAYVLDIRCLDE